jgi:xylulokinase
MNVLGLDIGSSSVKAGILRGDKLVGRAVRVEFPTHFSGVRAEVDPQQVLRALQRAASELRHPRVDAVALSVMSPSWLAMDRRGRAITPVITHQDRRSVDEAMQIERAIGKARHLKLAGNRPFPGGISSTTARWFVRNERALMRRADLVGHLNTLLHRRLTGARVTDPSNASFMGMYSTLTLGGWNETLRAGAGISPALLPEVRDANEIGGRLNRDGASLLGLAAATPMLVGITDTSSAMLVAGANPGQVLNVCGSTDVLAVCTDKPRPHERLLTRALGSGRMWMSVSTLASAGSTIDWMRQQLFADLKADEFFKLVSRAARDSRTAGVTFDPFLAGDRTSIEQRLAALSGLSLSTTREQILAAAIDALARASAARFEALRINPLAMHRRALLSGGAGALLHRILHRDWPGRWTFRTEPDATLRGLGLLLR